MTETVKLTELVSAGGCAAKIGPGNLREILAGLTLKTAPELLVGMDPADDAAVYKLSDDLAVVQTLDFFTPIVDDPYLFGQIAAANALSDVYAMGARPVLAMNIFAFPCGLGPDTLRSVLRGGAEKVEEAGALIVGGHSLEDKEPKYGLSVLGLVRPDNLVSNAGIQPGDALVLTKSLGLGVLTTALRARAVSENDISGPLRAATQLNKAAAEGMAAVGVHAATDVTGFGLGGHLLTMLEAGGCAVRLAADRLPVWPAAPDLAIQYQPGGTQRNSEFFAPQFEFVSQTAAALAPIIFDPQTSGGLLMSVAPAKLDKLLATLKDRGVETRAVIGRAETYQTGPRVIVE